MLVLVFSLMNSWIMPPVLFWWCCAMVGGDGGGSWNVSTGGTGWLGGCVIGAVLAWFCEMASSWSDILWRSTLCVSVLGRSDDVAKGWEETNLVISVSSFATFLETSWNIWLHLSLSCLNSDSMHFMEFSEARMDEWDVRSSASLLAAEFLICDAATATSKAWLASRRVFVFRQVMQESSAVICAVETGAT